jgi:SSS family transporter
MVIVWTLLAYFLVLLGIGALTGRGGGNEGFFSARRRSPWLMVALGMVGASISGVSFISVPGMAQTSSMTYLQMCLGFIPGYFIVASVLLPVFYSLGKPTIYSYLEQRLGPVSYRTGAGFFMLSKMGGTAVKFYVVCMILQQWVAAGLGVPFPATVCLLVLLVWLYTRRGGMKTLVWTDVFQTFAMFGALVLIIFKVAGSLGMDMGEAVRAVAGDPRSRIFVFDDPISRQYFWKQFISGILIVVVMTGLDQDMMQKNLTCKSLRDAQKNVMTSSMLFIVVNILFLCLGAALLAYADQTGFPLPLGNTGTVVPDKIFPSIAFSLSGFTAVCFVLGMVAAGYSSADGTLTALTTTFCYDFLKFGRQDSQNNQSKELRVRRLVHVAFALLYLLVIIAFRPFHRQSLIDTVFDVAGFTYGPLLGLYAFGLFTHRNARDRWVPFIAVLSPVVCYVLKLNSFQWFGYHFGFEILLLNGLVTFLLLWLSSLNTKH